MPLDRVRLVNNDKDVEAALDWLGDMDPVGADVERDDARAYWLRAALVQVGGNGKVALFDPVTLQNWEPVADWLANKCLILHAMENDVWPLARLGLQPELIEDTSLAAAFLGYERGLADLLHHLLGVDLDANKEAMQRSPWERRPLTPDEISYAAGDVADLPDLWEVLADELEARGRWNWYVEELDHLRSQPDPRERRAWHKTKGVGRLNDRARARAKAIWDWREAIAREQDMAPNLILPDAVVTDLAAEPVTQAIDLPGRGMTRRMVRTYGDELIDVLKNPMVEPEFAHHQERNRPSSTQKRLIDHIRLFRNEVAQDIGIDPGMVLPTKTVGPAIMAEPDNPEAVREAFHLRDWQWNIFGDSLAEMVLNNQA
ncbi:ribonuclease D [Stomatohabitans albus]|uniref:ribonuclease D n=1 Tax=Stomatohabitans albus TaxID=3110766 RepID=UPI00300CB897